MSYIQLGFKERERFVIWIIVTYTPINFKAISILPFKLYKLSLYLLICVDPT